MVRQRVRIQFSKKGNLRFIGHRDLLRALERLFRRARIPLAMSRGFHPKVRMSFPSALALGVAGESEVMEVELHEPMDSATLLSRLNEHTIEGLHFHAARLLREGEKKARLIGSVFEIDIPQPRREITSQKIRQLLRKDEVLLTRAGGKVVDLRGAIRSLTLEPEGRLRMDLIATQGADASFRDVLAELELDHLAEEGCQPVRTKVRLHPSSTENRNSGENETPDPTPPQ
jgi:radical SAM-linked protein